MKLEEEPDTVLVLAKRNFKVYASYSAQRSHFVRHLSVIDTGAGPNFFREDALPPGTIISPCENAPVIRDANKRALEVSGTTTLSVTLGESSCSSHVLPLPTISRVRDSRV